MGHKRQKVELTLDADLLSQVLSLGPDLSATVDRLLAAHLRREQCHAESLAQDARVLTALRELRSRVGSVADELSPL